MFSIGLTGGIGSGKTTVASCFAKHGITLIDTDQIAHLLTSAGGIAVPWIAKEFGPAFITQEGALDRALMRKTIFNDNTARQLLQAFLHPLIFSECERQACMATGPYLIYIVPLLIESKNWRKQVDRVLLVDCPLETQITRVMQRSTLGRSEVLAIIEHQASRAQRLAHADDVICNDDTTMLINLSEQVDELHQCYLNLASPRIICSRSTQSAFARAT